MKALLWLALVLVLVGGAIALFASLISLVGEIVGDPLARERQLPTVLFGCGMAILGGLLAIVPILRGRSLL